MVERKAQEGRNQGNSFMVRKGQEGETRGTVGGKIRTRRKKSGEQLVARKGQEGRYQGNSRC